MVRASLLLCSCPRSKVSAKTKKFYWETDCMRRLDDVGETALSKIIRDKNQTRRFKKGYLDLLVVLLLSGGCIISKQVDPE